MQETEATPAETSSFGWSQASEKVQGSKVNIVCFGLSHQTAALAVRERFALPESALPEALARLMTVQDVTEGVIVSTCNRTELTVLDEK